MKSVSSCARIKTGTDLVEHALCVCLLGAQGTHEEGLAIVFVDMTIQVNGANFLCVLFARSQPP